MGSRPTAIPGQPMPMQAGEFKPSAPPNLVSFQLHQVGPPSPLYIQRDDALGLIATSYNGSEVVTLSGRFLRASDSVIVPYTFQLPLKSAYTIASGSFSLGEGYLLSITVSSNIAGVRGQTYATVTLIRGKLSITPLSGAMQVLCKGYITTNIPNGWPGGKFEDNYSGYGNYIAATLTDPAIGADYALQPTTTSIMKVRSLTCTLVTSATVANRVPIFEVGTQVRQMITAVTAVTASQTKVFTLLPGVNPYTDANGNYVLPLPEPNVCWGSSTLLFGTITVGLQPADHWHNGAIAWEEWLFLN